MERDGYSDKLTVRVELAKATDSFTELEKIERTVRNKIKVVLGLDAKIKLESPNTLARFEGKAKRVKDLRTKRNCIYGTWRPLRAAARFSRRARARNWRG